ncbi:MAG: hypothetical protein MUF03_09510 [Rubrivivax sp.]|jgi:hypothetical protein|nr:hypothetical protein [Rubrivivax sp.]
MPTLPLRVLILAVAVLAGCATPARIERMQVDTALPARVAAESSALKGAVAVKEVTGGQETNPMWVSKVSSSDFERALEASLAGAGLLSNNRQGSPYTLTAHLMKLEQPLLGFDMTVTAVVEYTLVERATGKSAYAKTLTTPYTATLGAALLGMERLKLANEGAIRANIQRLIDDLTQFKPDGAGVPTR